MSLNKNMDIPTNIKLLSWVLIHTITFINYLSISQNSTPPHTKPNQKQLYKLITYCDEDESLPYISK